MHYLAIPHDKVRVPLDSANLAFCSPAVEVRLLFSHGFFVRFAAEDLFCEAISFRRYPEVTWRKAQSQDIDLVGCHGLSVYHACILPVLHKSFPDLLIYHKNVTHLDPAAPVAPCIGNTCFNPTLHKSSFLRTVILFSHSRFNISPSDNMHFSSSSNDPLMSWL